MRHFHPNAIHAPFLPVFDALFILDFRKDGIRKKLPNLVPYIAVAQLLRIRVFVVDT